MRNRRKETKKRNDTYVIVKLFIQGYSGDSIKLANRFVIYLGTRISWLILYYILNVITSFSKNDARQSGTVVRSMLSVRSTAGQDLSRKDGRQAIPAA